MMAPEMPTNLLKGFPEVEALDSESDERDREFENILRPDDGDGELKED